MRTHTCIHRKRLAENYREIRRAVGPGVAIVSVIKGDAYGHGAVEVARTCRGDENFDNNFVRAALVSRLSQVLPDDFEGLEAHLLGWANDGRLSPNQRELVFLRLSIIPRSECVEDFFVQFYVHDKRDFPNLSKVVDDALCDNSGNKAKP